MLPASCALAAVCALVEATVVEARVELRWAAPEACPQALFTAALDRYAGVEEPAGAPLVVGAEVRHEGARWLLDLSVGGDAGAGRRRLTADRCEVVVDAAAFIVAQALAGASVPPPPEPAPVVEPAPLPVIEVAANEPVEVVRVDEVATPVRTPQPRRWAALRLRGGASGLGLPGVQAALGGLVGVVARRWRVELTGMTRLPTSVPAGPGVARLSMWAVGARGCGVLRSRRLEFPLCGGAEVGQVRGRSEGLAADGRAAVVWAAVTASPGLAWAPRPWFALVLEGELAVGLVRHDWVVRGLAPFDWLGPVDVRGWLGVEFRLGRIRRP